VAQFREESEQHVVHRLEAFSDIVIGFSLAQMTLNVTLPKDALQILGGTLGAFALTFVVVAGMWWSHHRLFANYFIPTRSNIVLLFCSLAGVLLLVFSLQVWLHSTFHHYVAYAMYTGAIAWVAAIGGFLTYRGTVLRGAKMDPRLVTLGRRRAVGMTITATLFAALAAVSAFNHAFGRVQMLAMFGWAALVIALRIVERRMDKQDLRASEGTIGR